MKRLVSICCTLILAALLVAPQNDAVAQLRIKKIGRSLNQLTAPVKGSPAPTWFYATGLRAIGVQTRAYFRVDTTGSGQVGTPSWTLTPDPLIGSTATLDSTGTFINSFLADVAGQYVVKVTVGTQTASDTVYASTYSGTRADARAGCTCHGVEAQNIKTAWQGTGHAKIFTDGITGRLEVVPETNQGLYAKACVQCHTLGWQPAANNGNFGYVAHRVPAASPNSWDSTWFVGLPLTADGRDVMITQGDSTIFKALPAQLTTLNSIGCEVCHGPATDHKLNADPAMIGKSLDADVCNQCHDGSRRHSLGTFFNLSKHAILPTGGVAEGGRSSCQPCHTGKGFLYYLDHNKDTLGLAAIWNTATDANTPISCQVCHDPHSAANPFQLRTISVKGDSLRNGYILPANLRTGPGLLCANCHSSRYNVKARVTNTPPYYGFVNRFGPHENPQADMFYGSNGYQYGDTSFTGIGTHQGLEGGCTTCHMQDRVNRLDGGGNMLPNHSFSMSDTTFATGVYKPTDVCAKCHGEIEDFADVRAFYDYDRNGKIEGVETEVSGLLTQLKAILPQDAAGDPVTMSVDSLKVKNKQDKVQGIWNYYFVKNDKSMGIHNTKYAVRLLYKSLGWTPLWVKDVAGELPTTFALDQNYPNPFNPSTIIRFSLPTEQQVKLDVYDMSGALVKTVLNEGVRAGNKEVTWDGTNSSGAKVASGVYLYRLQAGSFTSVKKMIMLK